MRNVGDSLISALGRLAGRFTLTFGLMAIGVIAFLVIAMVAYIDRKPVGSAYQLRAVLPADSPVVAKDEEVRVAGQWVGTIKAVKPVPEGRLVTFQMVEEAPVGRDATVTVRIRGFAGSPYLFVDPGDRRRPLPSGSTIPRSQTRSAGELSDIATAFDSKALRGMERTLQTYGGGLLGRGNDINRLAADLEPFAQDSAPVISALASRPADSPGEFSGFLREIRRTSRGFAPPGTDELGPLVSASNGFFSATAREQPAIGEFFDELRPLEDTVLSTLPLADPLLVDTSTMSRRFASALDDLSATLPSLNRLLDRGRKLSELSRFARATDPVVREARPLTAELLPVASSLRPLADALSPFARYLHPYRPEIVEMMVKWNGWSRNRYSEGLAGRDNPDSKEYAVRFTPIFTCHRARNPFPKPGVARTQRQDCR